MDVIFEIHAQNRPIPLFDEMSWAKLEALTCVIKVKKPRPLQILPKLCVKGHVTKFINSNLHKIFLVTKK